MPSPNEAEQQKIVTGKIPISLWAEFRLRCAAEGRSVAEVLHKLILAYVYGLNRGDTKNV